MDKKKKTECVQVGCKHRRVKNYKWRVVLGCPGGWKIEDMLKGKQKCVVLQETCITFLDHAVMKVFSGHLPATGVIIILDSLRTYQTLIKQHVFQLLRLVTLLH